MTKLNKAVAVALGFEVHESEGQEWVETAPGYFTWLMTWPDVHEIADKLMDEHKIETEYFGRRWCATCEGVSAQHQDRKTAALMAFCKFKGVSYE